MDPELPDTWYQEANQKLVLDKLPNGDSKPFQLDCPELEFHQMSGSPPQMDSDLTPRHTEWCPHLRQPIIFAFNHVVKADLKYIYNVEMGQFEEVKCSECHLDAEKATDPKQIVLVASSPSTNKPSVLSVTEAGRLMKKQYDEGTKAYTDMEPTMIKALTMGPVEKEKDPLPMLTHLVEGSPIIMESDLLPQFRQTSQHLPDETILLAKNKQTGDLGAYLFDSITHQFLAVILPDIDIQNPAPEGRLSHACIAHIMLDSEEKLSLYHSSEETGIQKYMYGKGEMAHRLLEDAPVVQKASAIQMTMEEVLKQDQTEATQKVVKFLKTARQFMVVQDIPKPKKYTSIAEFRKAIAADKPRVSLEEWAAEHGYTDVAKFKKELDRQTKRVVEDIKKAIEDARKDGFTKLTFDVQIEKDESPAKMVKPEPSPEAEEVVKKMLKGLKDKFQEKEKQRKVEEGNEGQGPSTSDPSNDGKFKSITIKIATVGDDAPVTHSSDEPMASDTQSVSTDSFEMVSDEELKEARQD